MLCRFCADARKAGREEVSNDWQTSIGKERVRVEPKNIAQSSRNWYVPPLGLPLITKLSLYLSAPVNGIRCLSVASMRPIGALQAVGAILSC